MPSKPITDLPVQTTLNDDVLFLAHDATRTVGDRSTTTKLVTIKNNIVASAASVAQWNANKIQGKAVDATAIGNGKVLAYNSTTDVIEYVTPSGGGGGGTGEANTASNAGTTGIGVFLAKSGVDLQFKNLSPASNKLTFTNNATNKTIDIDIAEANLGVTSTIDSHVGNTSNPHAVTTSQIGAIASSLIGVANGIAPIGSDGKVASQYLPATSVGSVEWGNVTGTLSAQTDLQSALDAKASLSSASAAQWNANQLQGRAIATTAPTSGQVLGWNFTNNQWEPSTIASGGNGNLSAWQVKNNTYTALPGDRIIAQGNCVITLPPSPAIGDQVSVLSLLSGSDRTLLNTNSSSFEGQSYSPYVTTNYLESRLIYIDSVLGWCINPRNFARLDIPRPSANRAFYFRSETGITLDTNTINTVASWDNLSGSIDLTQADKAKQPEYATNTYSISGSNYPSVRIAKNSGRQMLSSSAYGLSTSFELYFILKYSNVDVSDSSELIGFGSVNGGSMFGIASGKPRIGRSEIAWDATSPTSILSNKFYLFSVRYSSAGGHVLRVNGVDVANTTNAPIFSSRLQLYRSDAIVGVSTADFLEIGGYSPILSSSERTLLELSINSEFNLF